MRKFYAERVARCTSMVPERSERRKRTQKICSRRDLSRAAKRARNRKGPRAVSERLSRGKGYFRGKPKIASMRNRRDCDLQSRLLRFDALFSGCQEIRIKKPRTKTIQSEKIDDTRRAEPRFPRDLVTPSSNDRALRRGHFARS